MSSLFSLAAHTASAEYDDAFAHPPEPESEDEESGKTVWGRGGLPPRRHAWGSDPASRRASLAEDLFHDAIGDQELERRASHRYASCSYPLHRCGAGGGRHAAGRGPPAALTPPPALPRRAGLRLTTT